MIISHLHKYAFFHAPKCAGTSISVALSKHTGPADIVTPHSHIPHADEDFTEIKEKNRGRHSSHTKPHECVFPDDYLKISIKRNPWDQVVSYWFWAARPTDNFTDFVKRGSFLDTTDYWTGMDYYVDFHRLEESYKELCKFIGIPYERLPRCKTKTRKHKGYRDMYNAETKKIVGDFYKDIIKKFNYTF